MIEASGEDDDSDEDEKEAKPPAECPVHKVAKTKGIMTDAEVVENSMLFLFAGKETTAFTLAFSSYLLALHPDVQEKLQSEIDAYFEEKPVSYIKRVSLCPKLDLYNHVLIKGIKSVYGSTRDHLSG